MQQGDQRVGELIARHREHVGTLASASAGRIIDWAGDGCFLTFETPSAAVSFALRLQQAHKDEPDLPGVRVGIHMGEVSERSGPDGDAAHPRIEGLAVDLAARICGLARPAQVLMSSAVADSARQRLASDAFGQPIRWRTHGSYSVKGFDEALEIREAKLEGVAPIEAPAASEKATPTRPSGSMATGRRTQRVGVIATVVGVAIAVLVWWTTSQPRGPHSPAAPQSAAVSPPARKAIAVLPFVNMSPDASDEYLSDGMTEELITVLSKIGGLQVAARTSSFAFKGKNQEIETIGQQLHVGTVLEGSVRKAGQRVRITAQLINVTDGYHLWSETYEEDFADLFTVQTKVAQRVAEALKIELGMGDKQRLGKRATENSEVHQLYLKGQYYTSRFTRAGMGKGKDYFQQAIDLDPNYAPAYLGLAYYYGFASSDYSLAPHDAMPKAAAAAGKALEIDPGLADAHAYLGWVHCAYDWNWAAADAEFRRAIERQPDTVVGHEIYGVFLAKMGRWEEAIAEGKRAVELDPRRLPTPSSSDHGENTFRRTSSP
jgi:TolB-like protein